MYQKNLKAHLLEIKKLRPISKLFLCHEGKSELWVAANNDILIKLFLVLLN